GSVKCCTSNGLLNVPTANSVLSSLKPMRALVARAAPAATPYVANTESTADCGIGLEVLPPEAPFQRSTPCGGFVVVDVAFSENGRWLFSSSCREERSYANTALPLPSAKLPPSSAETLYSSASRWSLSA